MKKSDVAPAAEKILDTPSPINQRVAATRGKLRLGGGPDKIERQHSQGKLTARERIDLLLDKVV